MLTTLLLLCLISAGDDAKLPENQKSQDSYVLGYNWGKSLRTNDVDVDFEQLIAGITNGMENKPVVSEDELVELLRKFQRRMRMKASQKRTELATKNLVDAEMFLAQNGNRTGVVTTSSGLQYKVMKQGDGPKPKADQRVKVHYRGTMLNGVAFDDTVAKNEPSVFRLDSVIDGWAEGLKLMSKGAKFMFWVHPKLGYGERGQAGGKIEPNALVIFEVELLDVYQ